MEEEKSRGLLKSAKARFPETSLRISSEKVAPT
jgi:hypothetical protein